MAYDRSIRCDTLVVGGGTAGCVLASRLSSRLARDVVLLEAGSDMIPGQEPADVLDVVPRSYANPQYRWPGLQGYWLTREQSRPAPLMQARVMGGGSSIMGMVALRGTPIDYDTWEKAGAAGWGWAKVLPYFKKLETDLDFGIDADAHGSAGPTEIQRLPEADWPPLARMARLYAEERRLPVIDDLNSDFRDGYGAFPLFMSSSRRSSSAICYLTPTVRARPNLRILDNTTVTRLIFDGRRVTGAVAANGRTTIHIAAREIILSAGALLSPELLLRNGIGPAEALQAAGVPVVADVPGVGRNLQNHMAVSAVAFIKPQARQTDEGGNFRTTCFRVSSKIGEEGDADLMFIFGNRSSWHEIGARIANLSVAVLAPYSRGSISLAASPTRETVIEYNLLGDQRDLARLEIGVRLMIDFIRSRTFGNVLEFPTLTGGLVGADPFLKKTRLNELAATIVAHAMDFSALAARSLMKRFGSEVDLDVLLADRDLLLAEIRQRISGLAHHAGTCRMGRADDPGAVVDEDGHVHGLVGLRVVDASIMPTVPRANTNLPTLMLAEKIADTFGG